ncbi:dihydrofolate reductase family protein [Streptomyces albidus (ex Kaewkla and Franco 2022)]|uniref:dihydrofolate reductase family protein n=1 Tax=Streptomyces albidus (ex Kaewkla and Franco 2022) TaxID=722709 RepID=UPI0015EED186|nr:dihydrofolate reductase family protein [Streptomyces albidus (ex Kaewkla and Franco 2022)]
MSIRWDVVRVEGEEPRRTRPLLKGDAADAVARLKEELDENLIVFGSGVLVRSLLPHGLIDEFVLLIHPLVLGSGRRLFSEPGLERSVFRLVESTVTGTGVIVAAYQPADAAG